MLIEIDILLTPLFWKVITVGLRPFTKTRTEETKYLKKEIKEKKRETKMKQKLKTNKLSLDFDDFDMDGNWEEQYNKNIF